jgi:Prolyl oligopeptidase family
LRNAERYKTLRQYWQASLEAMMKSLFMTGASALALAGAVYLGIIRAERIHLGFALPANEELDIYQHVHKSGILVASLWLSSIALAGPFASISGPVDKQGALAHRQLWRVPSTDPDVLMFATVFRPSGSGPLPLVVMNHGTTQNPVQRQYFPLLEFEAAALLFVRQGFVVAAPQHPGQGETGGVFLEDVDDCSSATFLAAGRAGAADIGKTIDHMITQSFVRSDHVVVVGQPAGGWDTLASSARIRPTCVRPSTSMAVGRSFSRTTEQRLPPRSVDRRDRHTGSHGPQADAMDL